MVYILGRFFENSQRVSKALTSIYGISSNPKNTFAKPPAVPTGRPSRSRMNLLSRVMAKHYIHPTAILSTIPADTLTKLTETLSAMTLENDLRRQVQADIARLRDMGSYRGRRHIFNLPVRGQNTRSQISTARKLNRIPRKVGMSGIGVV